MASSVTHGSTGGTQSLVGTPTTTTVATKGLTPGTGITLTPSGTDITVTNSDPASGVTLTSAGGTETLVNDGSGPSLATKGLTAGTGISLSGAATAVTITNSDPASGVTLTNAGTTTLVNDGSGPALATKGLVAGNYISFSTSATDITITANQYQTISDICIVYNSSDITVNNGATVTLTYNSEEYDPSGMHSTSMNTDRINILNNGIYLIQAAAIWSADASTAGILSGILYVTRSSTSYQINQCNSLGIANRSLRINGARVMQLQTNDYITFDVVNNSGVNKTISAITTGSSIYSSPILSVLKIGTT